MLRAIVVVSFGSTDDKVRSATIDSLAHEISVAYPTFEIRQAYTSNFIVRKLFRHGVVVQTVSEQISNLRAEGYEEITLLPTHLTAGEEFENKIQSQAADDVKILSPLLSPNCGTDFDKKVLSAVVNCFASVDEDLVLVGHGSPHVHNPAYENFQRLIDEQYKHIHVGVIEENDTPNFEDVVQRLTERRAEKIVLAPLLFSGGVHIEKDIKLSWQTRLAALGYKVKVFSDGLGTFRSFRQLYIDKLAASDHLR